MENNQKYVNNLLKISAGLPHRANNRIHEKTGYSLSLISRVRHGKAFNSAILEAIIEEYEKSNKRDSDLINKVNQLAK